MYKNVTELSRDQLDELKFNLYHEGDGFPVPELITDEEVYDYYSDTVFTDDDFFCTAE